MVVFKNKKNKTFSAQNGVKPGKFLFPVAAMKRLFKFVCSAAAITHTHTLSPFVSVCLYVTYQSHTQIHPSHLFRRGQRVGEGVGEKKGEREISGEGRRRVAV